MVDTIELLDRVYLEDIAPRHLHPAIKTFHIAAITMAAIDHLRPIIDHLIIINQDQPTPTGRDHTASIITTTIIIATNMPTTISNLLYLPVSNTRYSSLISYSGSREHA